MHLQLLLVIVVAFESANCPFMCKPLHNVKVLFHDENFKTFPHFLQGCLDDSIFENSITSTLVGISISNQRLNRLERGSIKNMKQLTEIKIDHSGLASIEPGAFRNLQNLFNIELSFGVLTEINRGVFIDMPRLNILNLRNNRISLIEEYAFEKLSKLRIFKCSYNRLTKWERQWFGNYNRVDNLETIEVDNNAIEVIPSYAFINMPKLQKISLNHNEITVISPKAFEDIRYLYHLGLRHNRLTVMDSNAFPSEALIHTLLLDSNHLNYLVDNDFQRKLHVSEISIYNNPWICSCLTELYTWLSDINAVMIENRFCVNERIPICVAQKDDEVLCPREIIEGSTGKYIRTLERLEIPFHEDCAKLY